MRYLIAALLLACSFGAQAEQKIPPEIECLRKNIYWEGRNEPLEGKIAIAIVTMNRVASDKYPKTICGVVTQAERHANSIPVRDRCQFSWYCDGLADEPHPNLCTKFRYYTYKGKKQRAINKGYNQVECAAWNESLKVAIGFVKGYSKRKDNLDGALYYHNTDVSPDWASEDHKVAQIGDHIFYSAAATASTQ